MRDDAAGPGFRSSGSSLPVPFSVGALLLAVLAAAACDRPPSESNAAAPNGTADAPFTVRDSAGVEIVVNHVPEHPKGQFWSFDPEPAFVLGGARTSLVADDLRDTGSEDRALGTVWGVGGLARLLDGRIAVLSSENGQLYLFEPSGELSRTIGGRGRGPGEFSRPVNLRYAPPDTLVVWDQWFGPVTRFDTTGAVLERRTIDLGLALERLPSQATWEELTHPLPDGSLMVEVDLRDSDLERPADNEMIRHPPVEYVRLDHAHETGSFGTWKGAERWAVPEQVASAAARASPFAGDFLAAEDHLFHTGGVSSSIAAGGRPARVYLSHGDTNEIRQYSLDGTLVRVIRRTTRPIPVTARAHRARLEDGARFMVAVNNGFDWIRPFLLAMPRSESYPPVHSLFVDADGRLWVREWSDSETGVPDRWSVFSPEGRWLGVLDGLPASSAGTSDLAFMSDVWIGRDFLLAVRFDTLGVERVEGYRIRRR